MPMQDALLRLATAYAPTAIGTNVQSTTYWNAVAVQDQAMGATGIDIAWYARIGTTVTGNATATLTLKLQGATDSAFTTPVDVIVSPTILQANFATQAVAGTEFKYIIPRGFPYQYWRFAVVIATATLTAGSFDSFVCTEQSFTDNKSYAAGYTV